MKHPQCATHHLDTSGTCEECFDLSVELEYAERYAVASIIYYGNTGIDTGMTDAQYDGFCDWLLQRQAWKRVPWIERELLICGSGFDTSKFPPELHARAQAQMGEALL
ncbi:MAG: hypothetical protein V3T08_09930 [Gemmatimonadota bacterium]